MVRVGDEAPLDLFIQGIRAEATRVRYTSALRQVVCEFLEEWLEGTFEERVAQLVKHGRDDPDWTRDLMITLTKKLRERTRLARDDPDYLNPISFANYFSPLKKLFGMNDVALSWNRIYATFPELDNMPDTAGWAREEIAGMLAHTRDPMDRALILVLASSGVRAGALPDLNWGDLTPVYRVDGKLTTDPGGEGSEVACAALDVYRGSVEGYTAFVTPEAFAALQGYGRAWAKTTGRQAKPEDIMFVRTRGVPRRMTKGGIQRRIRQMVDKAGLHDAGRQGKTFGVPLMNGFRRFYNKTCKEAMSGDSTLGSLIKKEYMMGHRGLTSLDQNYFKTDVLELAHEYVRAVPDLTINDEDRLRLSNKRMADNVRRMEDEKDGAMAQMQEVVARMEAKMSSMERAAREKDDEVRRLVRERDELVARGGGGANDKMVARMEERMASMQEEMAEMKRRRGLPAEELLAILGKSSETDGVSGTLLESLTGMVRQMGAAQEANIRELRREYDAEISKLKRRVGGADRPEGAAAD